MNKILVVITCFIMLMFTDVARADNATKCLVVDNAIEMSSNAVYNGLNKGQALRIYGRVISEMISNHPDSVDYIMYTHRISVVVYDWVYLNYNSGISRKASRTIILTKLECPL